MAWHPKGAKPLPEPIMAQLTYVFIRRPATKNYNENDRRL